MSEGVLKPGEIIKPCLDQAQAEELLTRLYGLTASSVKEFNSYDDRNFYFRVKETGDSIWPHGYILKVTNSRDPGNDYLLITSKTGWDILTSFWSTPLETLYSDWDEIIGSYHSSETNYLTSAL